MGAEPRVTLVVVPRERFSHSQTSLEDIFAHTEYPFDLVYVDVSSPRPVRRYLEQRSLEKGFAMIRTPHYISPNQARNVGLREVQRRGDSRYVVFVDNDVVVKPGWLSKMVECAEETGAAVVGPLTCIGDPPHQVVHNAGGRSYFKKSKKQGCSLRRIRQKAFLTGQPVAHVADELHRIQVDYVEFHCLMVRTSFFGAAGRFDEGMLATREHIDFCLEVTRAGHTVYCEREAVVTSDTVGVTNNKDGLAAWFGSFRLPNFKLYDLRYFLLRWNDEWDWSSLEHLAQKYELEMDDKYFHKRRRRLGYRRHELLIRPLVDRLTLGRGSRRLEAALKGIERRICEALYRRYVRSISSSSSRPRIVELQSSSAKPGAG